MSSAPEAMPQEAVPAGLASGTWRQTLRTYLEITRPRVMALVVFTGLPALALGQQAWPSAGLAFQVMLGTAFAGGACSALNAYVERDTDACMARTRNRPLPASVLLPKVVLGYGVALLLLSTAILWWVGGVWAAFVGVATTAFYVGVYTAWLKPRSPQNIVIGGAAGATAPLIASAAVLGVPSLGAWILFLIIFLWTPPHFWAIAIVRKEEYAAAGLPMMPLVVGDQPTRWRSLGYTLALIAVTLIPVWLGDLGPVYAGAALALNAWFLWSVVRSLLRREPEVDWQVFKASVAYLGLLFLVMLVDLAIPWGIQ